MGNYERLLGGELFPYDEPSLEQLELDAQLDKETQKYFDDLSEWIAALQQEKSR